MGNSYNGLWYKNNKNVLALITVDTNGKSSPNCDQAAVATGASGSYSNKIAGAESCNGRQKGFDRFTMAVYADGKIKINEMIHGLSMLSKLIEISLVMVLQTITITSYNRIKVAG